ncbi:MAG: metallopeptidase family protein [Specibacter sp.]
MQSNAQEPGFTVSFNDDAGTAGPRTPGVRSYDQRRRNRHGRGLRGPLLMAGLPGSRTRSEQFEDLVVDSAERLRELWGAALEDVEYLVEEVPDNLEVLVASGSQAPLGKYRPAVHAGPGTAAEQALVVIYRHPVEALCDAPWQVRELIHEVLIEQVAGLLNIDPDTVDPLFRRHRGH